MKSYFDFAGRRSLDLGITIEQCPGVSSAQRSIEEITVPGRNGSLIQDTGAYSNVIQSYEVWFRERNQNTASAARKIAFWLLSQKGYQMLEDSYTPDVFRMACFSGPLDVENWMLLRGRATLEFNCKPQRYFKDGQIPIPISAATTLQNDWMPALPLIQISGTGAGTLNIGESVVSITGMTGSLTVDSEVQDAYDGNVNMNNNITVSGGFPVLKNGNTAISFSGGIYAVQITPRWWTL